MGDQELLQSADGRVGAPTPPRPHRSPRGSGFVRWSSGGRPLRPPRLAPHWEWLTAPSCVALTALIQYVLLPRPSVAPFVLFFPGVALAAWLSGRRAGLLGVALSAPVANYLFVDPFFGWSYGLPGLSATALFIVGATPVALLCASLREALFDAERTAEAQRQQVGLLELSHDAIIVWRLGGCIEEWNRGAEDLYGYLSEEAVGQELHKLLRTGYPQGLAAVEAALRGEGRWQGTLRHTTKDGRVLTASTRLLLLRHSDGSERVLETTRDITDRIEAEERFRTLADSIAQLVWMADATGTASWYNQRWLDFAGMTHDEMLAVGWRKALHPDHVDRVETKLARCCAAGDDWEDTFPLRDKHGSFGWFLCRAIPIRDAKGQVTRWFGTCTDVTEQRDADQRKDEFLAVLSHELRNPLAPMRNSLYLLDRVAPGSAAARRAQAVIERQLTHLTRLVNDLLDVNRIARGKVRVRRERVDFAHVVGRALEDHQSIFTAAGVLLEHRLPPGPVWVTGDEDRLAQVVSNLLLNASKFTPKHGRVEVALAVEDRKVALRVRDTGMGIASELLGTLFTPFIQAKQALDRPTGGLGLGLALVKQLVEQHEGHVEARSDGLGRGAEFTIRLPLDAGALTETPPSLAAARSSGRRVLIIEDNVDAAETLKDALMLDAHEVAVAFDGPEGIEKARAFAPEVVLCDIGLPGMDGYEVARSLRADAALRAVALVALTGYALAEDQQKALEAGFERHLAKPPNIDVLRRILSELPARRAA